MLSSRFQIDRNAEDVRTQVVAGDGASSGALNGQAVVSRDLPGLDPARDGLRFLAADPGQLGLGGRVKGFDSAGDLVHGRELNIMLSCKSTRHLLRPTSGQADHKHMIDDAAAFNDRLDRALEAFGLDNATFAALLGESGQQLVGNWRKRGRIGAPSARTIRGLVPGFPVDWVNDNEGMGPLAARQVANVDRSQSERPDFVHLASSVTVLRNYLEIAGEPEDWVEDPILLEIAYEVVSEFGKPVTSSNVIDLTKVLAKRLRNRGETDEQRSIRGISKAAG